MVPPALPEVWQPVTEGDLEDLEDHTAYPAHLDISDNHHLKPPAKEVSHEMHVNRSIPDVKELICWVLRSIESAVLGIALLGKWLAKARVEEFEDLAGILKWLEQQEYHEQGIESHGS
jgi:hypothetical protein